MPGHSQDINYKLDMCCVFSLVVLILYILVTVIVNSHLVIALRSVLSQLNFSLGGANHKYIYSSGSHNKKSVPVGM